MTYSLAEINASRMSSRVEGNVYGVGAGCVPDGFVGGGGAFGEGGAEEAEVIDAADTGEGAEEFVGGEG